MEKRVLISVGGTGGHVYPALALAAELLKKHPEMQLLFVGGKLDTNRFFQGQPYAYQQVSCGSIISKNPFRFLKSTVNILKGIWQSRKIIKNYQPDLVVGFGSYHTFPTLFAAKLAKKPIILHEANSIPGKVNRLLSRHVELTGVNFPEAATHLQGTTIEVGLPLREEFRLSATTKEEARAHFGLAPHLLTVLTFGGSQGAKSINLLFSEAVVHHLIKQNIPFQVLHFTGDSQETERLRKLYAEAGVPSCVKDLEKQMNLAWTASDLIVSRAGAATIAEQMEFEVPGIFIPYPFATDNHQDKNADFMVVKVGGAMKFAEKGLTSEKLCKAIKSLLANDNALLNTMKQSIHAYKTRSKRIDLCSLVCELLETEVRS